MTATETRDPRERGPKPKYDQEQIAPPGLESEMTPKADHGEQSYVGSGKLQGVTGDDPLI